MHALHEGLRRAERAAGRRPVAAPEPEAARHPAARSAGASPGRTAPGSRPLATGAGDSPHPSRPTAAARPRGRASGRRPQRGGSSRSPRSVVGGEAGLPAFDDRRGTGPSASSWQSTPIEPSVTRWISRYDGGRLSCRPELEAAAMRGSAIRAACGRSQRPGELELVRAQRLQHRRAGSRAPPRRRSSGPAARTPPAAARRAPPSASPRAPAGSDRPIGSGQAVGQPGDRAEVDHAEPAVVEQPEVARMRVGVQQAGPGRRGEVQHGQQAAGAVALRPGCRRR